MQIAAQAHKKNVEGFAQATGLAPKDVDYILNNFGVVVHVGPSPAPGTDEWIQGYLLVNLLCRVFRRVVVRGCDPGIFGLSPQYLQRLATCTVETPDITLIVGTVTNGTLDKPLFVANRGWTVYISRERQWQLERVNQNPIAAYFAAALAVGEVFKTAFKESLSRCELLSNTYMFDVYNMCPATDAVIAPDAVSRQWDLRDILVVGLGAVGQAFVDALSLLPNLVGLVHLVDPDTSDESNEQRCVFAYPETRGQSKVDIVKRLLHLRHPFIRVKRNQSMFGVAALSGFFDFGPDTVVYQHQIGLPIPAQDYAQFRRTVGSNAAFPLVICAVDSAQCRRDIQFGLHKVVLNGWTTTSKDRLDFGIGRHEISRDVACMACRYQPEPNLDPTFEQFVSKRTGWDLQKVDQLLQMGTPISVAELKEIALARRIPAQSIAGMLGKPLRTGIHELCGVFQPNGSPQSAPVPHLAVMTGALLAAAAIREMNGDGSGLHLFQSDAQKFPSLYAKRVEGANPNCLCRDSDVQMVYTSLWNY